MKTVLLLFSLLAHTSPISPIATFDSYSSCLVFKAEVIDRYIKAGIVAGSTFSDKPLLVLECIKVDE